ncbi:MAG: hypothetical protein Kow0068_16630 [Marinilabiliales bacterium]
MTVDEAKDVFSMENYNNPLQQKYSQASMKMAEAMKSKDKDAYIQSALEMHEVEFQLFPKRFGPKIKQPAYVKKYLNFYKHYYSELIDNGFFEKNEERKNKSDELFKKLKYEVVDGKLKYEINEDFKNYLEDIKNDTIESIKQNSNLSAMQYYPETLSGASIDIMAKMSYANYIQTLHTDNINDVIEILELKTEFIDIDPVPVSEISCMVCNASLKIPEGSETIVCENCGTTNKPANKEIQCMNCGAPFEKNKENECPYCGSKMMAVGAFTNTSNASKSSNDTKQKADGKNIVENTTEKSSSKDKSSEKKKGLFGKLFG